MGSEDLHTAADRTQGGMSGYIVRTFRGDVVPDDYRGLIYSKWMRSLRYGNDYYRLMDEKSFYPAYQRHITNILACPDAVVHIAVLAEDHDVVLGFSVCRDKVLDYVHVHKEQRLHGIGRRLVPGNIDRVTHMTKTGLLLWGTKPHSMKFDPFA